MADGSVALDRFTAWLAEFARQVHDNADVLTALDSAIGDADHGSNMDRGMAKVVTDATGDTVGALMKKAGMTLISTVGGASGPLYGTFFLRFAAAAGDVGELDSAGLAAAFRAGLDGVYARGKAEIGDKTMLDALDPAVVALEASVDEPVGVALKRAADAADAGRDATIPMQARKGRASYLGERSVGHADPGATSVAMLVRAAADTLS